MTRLFEMKLLFLSCITLMMAIPAQAEDPPAVPAAAPVSAAGAEVGSPSTESAPAPADPSAAAPAQAKRARGGPREKEAEGTEAPNRFKADTIIKSEYLDTHGQPYEVDPE